MKKFKQEYDILQEFEFPSLVKIIEMQEYKNTIYLVMEYCHGGKLNDYIIKNDFISENEAGLVVYQILMSLNFLYQKNIGCGFLDHDNIMFLNKNDLSSVRIVGLAPSKIHKDPKLFVMGLPNYVTQDVIDQSENKDLWQVGVIL